MDYQGSSLELTVDLTSHGLLEYLLLTTSTLGPSFVILVLVLHKLGTIGLETLEHVKEDGSSSYSAKTIGSDGPHEDALTPTIHQRGH